MHQLSVQKVDLPTGNLVAHVFPRIDYADAYRMRLPAGAPNDLDAVVCAICTFVTSASMCYNILTQLVSF
jgi:hypothetical protein